VGILHNKYADAHRALFRVRVFFLAQALLLASNGFCEGAVLFAFSVIPTGVAGLFFAP
jgi:hypothetical protein